MATIATPRRVLAHIVALERAVEFAERLEFEIAAIEQLIPDAEAVAREYGHKLDEWYGSENLIAAARCQHCTATVCLKSEGHGSNGDPLRWLTHPCGEPRFFITKSRIAPVVHFVHDRERPQYEPRGMFRKLGDAKKLIAKLDAPADAPVVDELARRRAKVERLRKQLAKAEAELEAVAA